MIGRYNKLFKVEGTLEIGKDGFVEIVLMDKKDTQRQHIHLHRYPEGHADLWVFALKDRPLAGTLK